MRSNARTGVLWVVVVADVLTAFATVLTNLATEVVPESWRPHLWIAWPVLAVAVVVGVVLAVRLYRAGERSGPVGPERAAFARRGLLARVRATWINGVLDRSLYRRTIIELGLTDRPDLLARSWDVVLDAAEEEPRPLDRETALVDVLEQHRSVLVLGAPGAGKTTMLLTFLEELLDVAARDDVAPVPVVFPLASWRDNGRPLAHWLVDELSGPLYGIPPDVAREWVADDRVLPLLDGLDEVAPDHRLACARAIDDFHRSRRVLPLIASGRIAEYDALGLRLSLGTALLIQPLTRTQTEEYLDRLGAPLAGLREALAGEPALWELLRTPFLLNVAVRAYQGLPAAGVRTGGTLEQRQDALITAFVDRALRRRRARPRIAPVEAVRRLAFLARALGRDLDTYFFLEAVDMRWLSPRLRRLVVVTAALPAALLFGGAIGLPMGLLHGTPAGVTTGVLAALGFGLPLCRGKGAELRYRSAGRRPDLLDVVLAWPIAAAALAIFLGLLGAVFGAPVGMVLAVGAVISGGSFGAPPADAVLVGGTAGGLLGVLLATALMMSGQDRASLRDEPSGTGLRDAVWFFAMVIGILGVPLVAVLSVLCGPAGAAVGALTAVSLGYAHSGRGLLTYWLCRLLLARAGVLPLRLLRFLDFAVDRMVMLKVGGGYLFLHRLLLEHFARVDVPGPAGRALPAVDLRPQALLARAVDEAERHPDSIVRLLSYARSVLPAETWAPTALRVAEILERNLPAPPAETQHRDNLVSIVISVLRMVIAAEHTDTSPVAAVRLGELLVREPPAESYAQRDRLSQTRYYVIRALEAVIASGDGPVVTDAKKTLARDRVS
ncbi:hypothetical protein SUDANB95_01982 [Actinosynnema sp. ALI-1.44]